MGQYVLKLEKHAENGAHQRIEKKYKERLVDF